MVARPPPLSPGAPVAVVAPASPPRDLDVYEEGVARLRTRYDVRSAWQPGMTCGYLAAPDADRAAALQRAILNPEIRAVFCVRGGYGCLRLLPHIDWAQARAHPTLLVGYSDITALHLALYARAGWSGLSGPVVTEWTTADAATLESFRNWSMGTAHALTEPFEAPLHTLVPGTATGPLLGGNLSVLTRLIGTPFAPSFDGALLVLEDVAEAPYRIDRMLAHLEHAGVLDRVAGVVLGSFSLPPSDAPARPLSAVVEDYFGHRDYPVVHNLPYGHCLPRCSVPIGVTGRLHASSSSASLSAASVVATD